MRKYLAGSALVVMALSLNSCGLLETLGRTVGNTAQKVGSLAR